MDRLLNYSFALILIYIFALWAPGGVHSALIVGLAGSLLFCGFVFMMGWLTIDGTGAAIVIGTAAFGFGGWPTAAAIICFFLSSTLFSIEQYAPENTQSTGINYTVRRNGKQVWANGFWLMIWLIAGILTNLFVCWLAAITAIATATADTWATELGSRRFKTTTYVAGTLKEVPAGTNGGISWPGMIASLAGSLFVALIAAFGFSLSLGWFALITLAGFLGSVIDSALGATYQGSARTVKIPGLRRKRKIDITNNVVNWMATGLGSLLLLILNQIFL